MLYLNGQPLPVTIFPDNTSQVWKLPESTFGVKRGDCLIRWDYSDEAEVMHLFQLLHLLEKKGVEPKLEISYLPYARQDKNVSNETTFALNTFLRLLNSFNCLDEIVIHDPHNQDAFRPSCRWRAVYPTNRVEEVARELDKNGALTIFCYPDAGALKKYSKVYAQLERPHIHGEKVRDQLTGNITSYKLVGDPIDKNVIIVDDICDGGATFKILAKDLLAAGAKSVVLFVTHGLFSKGTRTLFESGIQRVFTKDGEVGKRTGSLQF